MASVQDMRAKLQNQKKSSSNISFYAVLGVIVACGLGGIGYTQFFASAQLDKEDTVASISAAPTKVAPGTKSEAKVEISSGNRIGDREKAPILGRCLDSMQIVSMMSLNITPEQQFKRNFDASRAPNGNNVAKAGFAMMDQYMKADGLMSVMAKAGAGGDREKNTGGFGSMMFGDFVECTITQSPQAMCNPHNRAAAMSYINHYIASIEKAEVALAKMDPVKRFKEGKHFKPEQKKRILYAIGDHSRAGSLVASDVGWFPHAILKEAFEKNSAKSNVCLKAG